MSLRRRVRPWAVKSECAFQEHSLSPWALLVGAKRALKVLPLLELHRTATRRGETEGLDEGWDVHLWESLSATRTHGEHGVSARLLFRRATDADQRNPLTKEGDVLALSLVPLQVRVNLFGPQLE